MRDLELARRAYESDRENELYQQEYLRQLRRAGLDVQHDIINVEIGRVEDLKRIREVADKLRYLAPNREAALQAARFIVGAEFTPEDEHLYNRVEHSYYHMPDEPYLIMMIIWQVLDTYGTGPHSTGRGNVQALYLPLASLDADTVVYFYGPDGEPHRFRRPARRSISTQNFEIISYRDLQDIMLESEQHDYSGGLTGPTEWHDIMRRGRPYFRGRA